MPKHNPKRRRTKSVRVTCPVGFAPKATVKVKRRRNKVTYVVSLGRCVKVCTCPHAA